MNADSLVSCKIGNGGKESIDDKAHVETDTNLGKESQILQEARAVPLGRFGGTLGH